MLTRHVLSRRKEAPYDPHKVGYKAGAAKAAGTSTDVRGRIETTPQWPEGGYVLSRPMQDRWDVQQFTGYPTSTVGEGNWVRGKLIRMFQVELRTPRELFMYDPTDVTTWHLNTIE